jgi:hypothetical protein
MISLVSVFPLWGFGDSILVPVIKSMQIQFQSILTKIIARCQPATPGKMANEGPRQNTFGLTTTGSGNTTGDEKQQ